MQRRLSEELKYLEVEISRYKEAFKEDDNDMQNLSMVRITSRLNKLLSSPDKAFEVTFDGQIYDFIYPTTPKEQDDMNFLITLLIGKILAHCVRDMENGKDSWWMVTAFASGIDTLDMQIEIIKEDVVNRVDAQGERITALPLDMDNYQINLQRPDVEFEDELDIN